jgi:hypothetical protein
LLRLVASTFGLLLLGISSASAETAEEVHSLCREAITKIQVVSGGARVPLEANVRQCWGMFSATADLIRMTDPNGRPELLVCAPENRTVYQLIRIFDQYVTEHPEKGHLGFGEVVLLALSTAFPCPLERVFPDKLKKQ